MASTLPDGLLAIADRPVDFAGRNKLTRIVNGPHLEGETPADGRGRLGDDLEGPAHSGCASVLDVHRCADGIPSAPPRWRTCVLAQRKKVLTLVTATKDIDISEVAVVAKLVLLS